MVHALAAYIHFNRLQADFPGVKLRSKPGPKPGRKKGQRKTKKAERKAADKKGEETEVVCFGPRAIKKIRFAKAYRKKYPGKPEETLVQALARSFNEHGKDPDWRKAMKGAGISEPEFNSSDFYIWRTDPLIKPLLKSKAGIPS